MRCLVVDANVAFATLLSEELTRLGHEVMVCHSGEEALARPTRFDLALLDMGLEAPDAPTLALALRQRDPGVRLVLIPMMGDELQLDADAPSIQGVLPKPFFLPELPERIEAALTAPLELDTAPAPGDAPEPEQATVAVEQADPTEARGEAPWRDAFARHRDEVAALLGELAYELGADGVLLTDGEGTLHAVGSLPSEEIEALGRAVRQGWQSALEVGRILGREQVRFEQSLAGGDYTLYALGVDGADGACALDGRCDAVLAVAVAGEATLGLLRHRARATTARIAALIIL